jgi:uncharacterized protein YecA (UPF0149 family)
MKYPKVTETPLWVKDYPNAIREIIDEQNLKLQGKLKDRDIKHLQQIIQQHSKVPQLYVSLRQMYAKLGRTDKVEQVEDKMQERFPDYLFSRVFLAKRYDEKGEVEKIPEVLGDSLSLSDLYPGKEVFTPYEIATFYDLVYRYYFKTGQDEKAEETSKLLKDTIGKYEVYDLLEEEHMLLRMQQGLAFMEQSREKSVEAIQKEYDKEGQTDEPPKFQHEEIRALYEQGWDIDEQSLQRILNLPRESLIRDLEEVLRDSIRRFEYYYDGPNWEKETHTFPTHAAMILAELRAKESLPVILDFLRQGGEFRDYWVADLSNDIFIPVLYHLAEDQPRVLVDFIKEPDVFIWSKSLANGTLVQITLHQPQRRKEVLAYFREIMEYFFEQRENEHVMDSSFLGSLANSLADMGAKELEQDLEKLYAHNLVDEFAMGDWPMAKKELHKFEPEKRKEPLYTLREHYKELSRFYEIWEKREKEESRLQVETQNIEAKVREYEAMQEPVKSQKVGRNDPCPCGSGKKYKKCCGKAA